MKKTILTLIIVLGTMLSFAQSGKYVSAGTSYSTNQLTYGAELGLYGEKAWYGALVETTKDVGSNHYTTYLGTKLYYKLAKLDKVVDLYGYGAMKVGLVNNNPLQFEGGLASVINLSDKFALQVNMSLPKYEGVSQVNPSFGLCLNYYF